MATKYTKGKRSANVSTTTEAPAPAQGPAAPSRNQETAPVEVAPVPASPPSPAAPADLAPDTAVAFTVAESRLHGVVSDTRGRYVVVRVGAHQHWVTRDRLVVEGRR